VSKTIFKSQKRSCPRKYDHVKQNELLAAAEYRFVVDEWILGRSIVSISIRLDRPESGVRQILNNVSGKYTENGIRKCPINDRLSSARSDLSRRRDPVFQSAQEKEYFIECWRKGRTLSEMSIIFHVHKDTIVKLEAVAFPARDWPFFGKEFQSKYRRLAKEFKK